jgi:hypothetical protein
MDPNQGCDKDREGNWKVVPNSDHHGTLSSHLQRSPRIEQPSTHKLSREHTFSAASKGIGPFAKVRRISATVPSTNHRSGSDVFSLYPSRQIRTIAMVFPKKKPTAVTVGVGGIDCCLLWYAASYVPLLR